MRHFILGKDHARTPKKTALLVGQEMDDAKVITEFHRIRNESVHPDAWAVIELWNHDGCQAVSVARWKSKAEKAAAEKAVEESQQKQKGQK